MDEREVLTAERAKRLLASLAPFDLADEGLSRSQWGYRAAAAVLNVFDTAWLKPFETEPDEAILHAFLTHDCDRVRALDGRKWRLQDQIRAAAISRLSAPSRLLDALAANPDRLRDPTQRMIEKFLREESFSLTDLSLDELYGAVQAIDWLKASEVELPQPGEVEAHLALTSLLQPLRELIAHGFIGRQRQLAVLREYADVDSPTSPRRIKSKPLIKSAATKPPLVIHGPGGIGKSTLIAKFLIDHADLEEDRRFPYAYLALDRPDLSPMQPLTLLIEASRQVGAQYRDARESAQEFRDMATQPLARTPTAAQSPEEPIPQPHLEAFRSLLEDIAVEQAPFLLVLDTFEDVQRRGPDAVETIWRAIEQMQIALPRLRSMFVGRNPLVEHQTQDVPLEEFDQDVARSFMQSQLGDLAGDPSLTDWAISQVGKNPLSLKLAAEVIRTEGPDGLADVAHRSLLLSRVRDAQIQGQLYGRILDHINDPDVQKLAHPGLVLRRITPDLIQKVLAGPCEVNVPTHDRAEELFATLRQEASLVEPTDDGTALRHRADVRSVMLNMLYQDLPDKVEQIHRRAIRYYHHVDGIAGRAEELYHRLALGQATSTIDKYWSDDALPLLAGALDELKVRGRAYLADKLGLSLDEKLLREVDDDIWMRNASRRAKDLKALNRFDDALRVIRDRRSEEGSSLLPEVEADLLIAKGMITDAKKVVEAGMARSSQHGDAAEFVRLARLGAWLEEETGDLPRALDLLDQARKVSQPHDSPSTALDAATSALRLLRKMNLANSKRAFQLRKEVAERARQLSRYIVTQSPALLRNAAAEVGDENRDILTEALRVVDVDVSNEKRQTQLAVALSAWDAALSKALGEEPGALARVARVGSAPATVEAWHRWILRSLNTGLGVEIRSLLQTYPEFANPTVDFVVEIFRSEADTLVPPEARRSLSPRGAAQPLPEPSGAYPFRLDLRTVIGRDQAENILTARKLTFHVLGNTGGVVKPTPQQIVASAMIRDSTDPATSPTFCYLLGDLVYYNGQHTNYYAQFYAPYEHYPAPIFAIPGNHDGDPRDATVEPSLAAFVENFCATNPRITPDAGDVQRTAMTQPNVYWTLVTPFVWLIGLYSNVPQGGYVDEQQIAWLQNELASAPPDVAVLVAMHHPVYSADQYHGGSAYMRQVLRAGITASGRIPDVVLSAQINNYQRFTETVDRRQVPHIIAGAGGYWNLHRMAKVGGKPLPRPLQLQDTNVVLENYCDDRHGFLRLTVTPTELHGEYMAVSKPREPWNRPAQLIDTFTLDLNTHTLHTG